MNFFLRFGCKYEIDKDIFVLFLPLLIGGKLINVVFSLDHAKLYLYNYDMCTRHFIDFVFLFGYFFFANCNDVHFADWNNELLEKEKKPIHFVNWNNIHF